MLETLPFSPHNQDQQRSGNSVTESLCIEENSVKNEINQNPDYSSNENSEICIPRCQFINLIPLTVENQNLLIFHAICKN